MTQDNNLEAAPSESHEDENEYDSESFEYGDEGVSGEEAGSPGSLTEVIYVRGGVSIRPTPSSHIKGRLSLVRQDRVLFIAWLPSALRHRKARAPASPSPVGEKAEGELGASPAAGSPENKEAYGKVATGGD